MKALRGVSTTWPIPTIGAKITYVIPSNGPIVPKKLAENYSSFQQMGRSYVGYRTDIILGKFFRMTSSAD